VELTTRGRRRGAAAGRVCMVPLFSLRSEDHAGGWAMSRESAPLRRQGGPRAGLSMWVQLDSPSTRGLGRRTRQPTYVYLDQRPSATGPAVSWPWTPARTFQGHRRAGQAGRTEAAAGAGGAVRLEPPHDSTGRACACEAAKAARRRGGAFRALSLHGGGEACADQPPRPSTAGLLHETSSGPGWTTMACLLPWLRIGSCEPAAGRRWPAAPVRKRTPRTPSRRCAPAHDDEHSWSREPVVAVAARRAVAARPGEVARTWASR
jgi:hypothetical protein